MCKGGMGFGGGIHIGMVVQGLGDRDAEPGWSHGKGWGML